MGDEQNQGKGLRTYLQGIPDPRRRQGRIYPLVSILMMLILAAVNGERSLRGMLVWAQQHWEQICGKLGMEWLVHPPVYGTLWRVLALLEMAQVEQVLSRWVQGVGGEAISVDGKSLRGSRRREGLPALEVVVAAAQGIRIVLSREGVEESHGSGVEASPGDAPGGEGSDTGCRTESTGDRQSDRRKRGAYLGVVKENHGEVREALLEGIIAEKGASPPDIQEWNRRHGRMEVREYWWVEADEEMKTYLEQEFGWPEVRWYGRVRRWRALLHSGEWSTKEVIVIYGKKGGPNPTPQQLSRWVRGHWEIENGVFWVLDVTYQEDRNHARKVGRPLHAIRCVALNVIRQQGFRYVPDGHRAASARPDRGLAWLGIC